MTGRINTEKSLKAVTLMEMVIALAIMAAIFAAVLPQFRLIHNSWDIRQASADTIQNGRVFVDFLNRNLAKAVKVTDVSLSTDTDGYIEFEDTTGTVYRCDLGSNNYIQYGPVGSQSDLAGPVSSLKFVCYGLDDLDNPTDTVTDIRYVNVEAVFTNSAENGQDKTFTASGFLQANGNPTETTTGSGLPGIAVNDYIDYGGSNAVFDSYHSSQGSYSPSSAGSEAVVTTNSKKNGRFVLYNNATIKGDGYVGKGSNLSSVMKLYSGSQITGVKDVLEDNISIPNNSFPSGSTFTGNPPNAYYSSSLTISEDKYFKNLGIEGSATLTIDGDVSIGVKEDFWVLSNASVELTSGSTLKLYIKKQADIAGDMNVVSGTPNDLRIYMTGNKAFSLYGGSEIYAVVSNPKGNVELWGNSTFYGIIMAKNLYGNRPVHIDMDARFDGDTGGSSSSVIEP